MTLHTERELLDRPTPPMLVDNLLVTGTLNALISKHGVGKSFLALDLALSIAAGLSSYLGFPLRRSGPVVYVLSEGAGRFKLRIKVWKQRHGIYDDLPFYWTDGAIDLTDSSNVTAFIESIERIQPALVVIDTLSRCIVGADENSQASMSGAVKHCDQIRTSVPNLTVLILHHMNASGSRERGSTVVPGALDTQLLLKRKKGSTDIELQSSKQKDLDDLAAITLHKHVIEVVGEFEQSGAPSTSCLWTREAGAPGMDPLIAFVTANPGLTQNTVIDKMGRNRAQVINHIRALEKIGALDIRKQGQCNLLYPGAAPERFAGSTPSDTLRVCRSGTGGDRQKPEPVAEPVNIRKNAQPPQTGTGGNRTGTSSGTGGDHEARNRSAEPVKLSAVAS